MHLWPMSSSLPLTLHIPSFGMLIISACKSRWLPQLTSPLTEKYLALQNQAIGEFSTVTRDCQLLIPFNNKCSACYWIKYNSAESLPNCPSPLFPWPELLYVRYWLVGSFVRGFASPLILFRWNELSGRRMVRKELATCNSFVNTLGAFPRSLARGDRQGEGGRRWWIIEAGWNCVRGEF